MNPKDFLETVLGESAGYATIVTKDTHGAPTVQKFFSYPDELDAMSEYAKTKSDEDVYFSPILFYEERRIRETPSRFRRFTQTLTLAIQTTSGCHPQSMSRHLRLGGTLTGY